MVDAESGEVVTRFSSFSAAAQESTRISSIHFEREWVPHVEVLEIVFASSPNCGFNVLNLGMKDAILRTLLVTGHKR